MKYTIRDLVNQIEDFFFVETKDSEVAPFKLNIIQSSFIAQLIKYLKDNIGKPLRVIILKGRQFGFSTLIIAYFLVKCLLVKNTRAVVISHEGDATKKLFRKVKFFINTFCLPAVLDKESEKAYSFPKTNSSFYIGTAGAKAFGRGDNITDLHCSEVAFWENPGIVMNGLLQAVGMTGNIFIETTANGVGNYFYKLWLKSYKNLKSAWLAIFFKWTKFAEYEMDVPKDFVRTGEESQICALHKEMTDSKLMWRRWKISETEADAGFTPEQIFMQEYPLTPQEAFIHSGRAVFSLEALQAYKPKPIIDVEDGWQIWKKPSGYSIASIDVAEGIENNDRHVIDIYDEHLEQVAHWAGWGDIDELAIRAIKIMNRYKSFCIPEVNGPGIAFMGFLKNGVYKDGVLQCAKYPVHKIYKREEFDKLYKEKKEVAGWRTTTVTRNKMIPVLATYIREHAIILNNPETIDECMSFIKNKNGKPEAIEGANDDRVMTAALAVQGYIDHPPKIKMMTAEEKQKMEVDKINKDWRRNRIKNIKKRRIRNKRLQRK